MSNEIVFRKAERKKAKARIALCSPSGGGKTHSALLIAKGMGGSIAVIDTENGSAQMEAGKKGIPEFDVLTLESPFTVPKYIEAIHAAEEAGYDVIIIDSLTHAWAGSGGLLEKKDKVSQLAGKNSYTAWGEISPIHNLLIETMLQSKCHLIVTMRSKVEYVLEENEKGKMAPVKKGMAPIQREGMDYEFTICFDLEIGSHLATAPKDRTSLFGMNPFVPSEKTGKELMAWLNGGASEHPGEDQTATFQEQLITLGMTQEKWEEATKLKWNELTIEEAGKWIKKNAFAIEKREEAKVEEKEREDTISGENIFNPDKVLKELEAKNNSGGKEVSESERKFVEELDKSLEVTA
ncbi:MAG: ATP-binding protein [Patescibacteria group bacterium]